MYIDKKIYSAIALYTFHLKLVLSANAGKTHYRQAQDNQRCNDTSRETVERCLSNLSIRGC